MTASLVSHAAGFYASGEAFSSPAPVQVTTIQTGYAALVTAMGVLVADGASPTQAHVTTANTALTALKAIIDAAVTLHTNGVIVTADINKVTDLGMLTKALNEIKKTAQGAGHVKG